MDNSSFTESKRSCYSLAHTIAENEAEQIKLVRRLQELEHINLVGIYPIGFRSEDKVLIKEMLRVLLHHL